MQGVVSSELACVNAAIHPGGAMKIANVEALYLRQPESGRAPTARRTPSPEGEDAIGVLMTRSTGP